MPGELIHVDTKKLGRIHGVGHRITGNRRDGTRGVGWEFAHVAIDDASRLAYVEVLPDEHPDTAVGFLYRALAFYRRHGLSVHQLMSDNGNAYLSRAFVAACQRFRIRHLRSQPYTPRTNGKAERLIQTLLREWAYPCLLGAISAAMSDYRIHNVGGGGSSSTPTMTSSSGTTTPP